ncbi:hypothetical protein CRG98_047487 [Punica granatum]|uniref:Uncharacterized protein n=1 Tax=Punica granatum TaxID=22663 RepID=A0A2I0HKA7_PUNGR|nr:hypothetical protein CRG98_047487 [Punica granatum]
METRYRVAGGVELKLDESECPRPSGRRHRWGEEIGRTSGSMEVHRVDLILIADGGREGIGSNDVVRLGEGRGSSMKF